LRSRRQLTEAFNGLFEQFGHLDILA
jgi:hypothetical protein